MLTPSHYTTPSKGGNHVSCCHGPGGAQTTPVQQAAFWDFSTGIVALLTLLGSLGAAWVGGKITSKATLEAVRESDLHERKRREVQELGAGHSWQRCETNVSKSSSWPNALSRPLRIAASRSLEVETVPK